MPNTNKFFGNIKKSSILITARDIIYNKYVLYVVFLAALFDLLYSVVKQDYLYCILFILVGFVIAFFNKNMTVILTFTIAVANILKTVISGKKMDVEGFDQNKSDKTDEPDEPDVTEKKDNKQIENVKSNSTTMPVAKKSAKYSETTTSPSELVDSLKENALDLQELQQKIIQGFEQIEPHMDRAESLIGSIQETAQSIQQMRNKQ